MRLVFRSEDHQGLLRVLDPKHWLELWPKISVKFAPGDGAFFSILAMAPMGLQREVRLQRTDDNGVARLDIVESDWLAGWVAVVSEDAESSAWHLELSVNVLGSVSGAFLEELRLQFESDVARLVAAEDAL